MPFTLSRTSHTNSTQNRRAVSLGLGPRATAHNARPVKADARLSGENRCGCRVARVRTLASVEEAGGGPTDHGAGNRLRTRRRLRTVRCTLARVCETNPGDPETAGGKQHTTNIWFRLNAPARTTAGTFCRPTENPVSRLPRPAHPASLVRLG